MIYSFIEYFLGVIIKLFRKEDRSEEDVTFMSRLMFSSVKALRYVACVITRF